MATTKVDTTGWVWAVVAVVLSILLAISLIVYVLAGTDTPKWLKVEVRPGWLFVGGAVVTVATGWWLGTYFEVVDGVTAVLVATIAAAYGWGLTSMLGALAIWARRK